MNCERHNGEESLIDDLLPVDNTGKLTVSILSVVHFTGSLLTDIRERFLATTVIYSSSC